MTSNNKRDTQHRTMADAEKILKSMTRHADFPKKGILFYDMMPILADPPSFQLLTRLLTDIIRESKCDVIVGLDARGFLIGPPCALELGLPFVPVRKRGKLPGECHKVSYQLEYGEDAFEVQKAAIQPGKRVAIIDDLLATGGTMSAACGLVEQAGAEVVLALVVTHLQELHGEARLPKHVPFTALIQV